MVKGVMIAAFLLLACLASSPLVRYLKAKRRHEQALGRCRTLVIMYYGVVLACTLALVLSLTLQFNYSSRSLIQMTNAMGFIAFIILICASLSGPCIALDLISALKKEHAKFCRRCGYDLTGNTSGVCPECGSNIESNPKSVPSVGQRIKAVRWRRLIPLYVIVLALLAGLLGYVRVTTAWVCSECGRYEFRVRHQLRIPFGGLVLFEVQGGLRRGYHRPNPLTPFLDPNNNCQHNWVGFGWNGEGMTTGWRGIGVDPSSVGTLASEPDFDEFIAQHPDVLDRIRSDLRARREIAGWFSDKYMEWKDESPEATKSP